MGTDEFASIPFEKLASEFEIVAVYTRKPQIAGRGHKVKNSLIHDLALKHQIKNIITPDTFKDEKIQQEFRELNADAAVVVSYGLILPASILGGTKFGCINLHPSLLPRWRGATPIQQTILAGDKETAVTVIKMDPGVDSGDIILQKLIPINGKPTYLELSKQLAHEGADLLVASLKKLAADDVLFAIQDKSQATYTKKISKENCKINWNLSAAEIERKIRAHSGFMETYFEINGERIKVFLAEIVNDKNEGSAGAIVDDNFVIQCGSGQLRPLILQRPGKIPINIKQFIGSFKFKIGEVLA